MSFIVQPLTEEEEGLIEEKINAYANSMAPPEPHTEEGSLVFKVETEEGRIVGGCVVNIHPWGRAVLAQLWVDGRYRHHGLGSLLIRTAENAAREKGCYYLCLGTADYMARPLYEKHGFRVFTVNRDIPLGHVSWSLSKRLDQNIPDYIPTDNTAVQQYQVKPGSKEDARIIGQGLGAFCEEVVPDRHAYIPLSRKLVDGDGNLIAAVISGVSEDDTADIDGIWVAEDYRRQGIGTRLFEDFEREAKEHGAYVILSYCCDWVYPLLFPKWLHPPRRVARLPQGSQGLRAGKADMILISDSL